MTPPTTARLETALSQGAGAPEGTAEVSIPFFCSCRSELEGCAPTKPSYLSTCLRISKCPSVGREKRVMTAAGRSFVFFTPPFSPFYCSSLLLALLCLCCVVVVITPPPRPCSRRYHGARLFSTVGAYVREEGDAYSDGESDGLQKTRGVISFLFFSRSACSLEFSAKTAKSNRGLLIDYDTSKIFVFVFERGPRLLS